MNGVTADQIAQIKANSTRYITTTVRGVQGGVIITGQTQYNDKDTNGVVMTANSEAVATTPAQAAQMMVNYFNTSTFDGIDPNAAAQQANLFAAPQTAPAAI